MRLSQSTNVPLEPAGLELPESFTGLLDAGCVLPVQSSQRNPALSWLCFLSHHLFSIMEISIFLCSLHSSFNSRFVSLLCLSVPPP